MTVSLIGSWLINSLTHWLLWLMKHPFSSKEKISIFSLRWRKSCPGFCSDIFKRVKLGNYFGEGDSIGSNVFSLYILFPQPYRYLNSVLISVILTMFRSTIAKLSMTSPVVISVPTRALLTSETMGTFCSVVGKFKYQKKFKVNVCKQIFSARGRKG